MNLSINGSLKDANGNAVKLEDYAPSSVQFLAADADKNGVIEAGDARTILRVSVRLESFA